MEEEKLLKMAKKAGNPSVAEHYMCAYLANAVLTGNSKAIKHLNEIRKLYGCEAIPGTEEDGSQEKKAADNATVLARKKYKSMSDNQKGELMRESLKYLIACHRGLFKSKLAWNGIYLVVKDRIDESVSRREFMERVKKSTPDDWPEELRIGETTLGNFSHYVEYSDRVEAYYDMENNPWEELCNTFWEILKMKILTGD